MKWLLIIPLAIFELLFLAVCWVMAVVHPLTAEKMVKWSLRAMPGVDWYTGSKGKEPTEQGE